VFECKFNVVLQLSVYIKLLYDVNSNFHTPSFNQYSCCIYLACCCVLSKHKLHFLMVCFIQVYSYIWFLPDDGLKRAEIYMRSYTL
jgi:hypothetical protein